MKKYSKSYVILEKGSHVMQGIIEIYLKGKKVYPAIPKRYVDEIIKDKIILK